LEKTQENTNKKLIDPNFKLLFTNDEYLLISSKNRLLNYSLSQTSVKEEQIKSSINWNTESRLEVDCKGQNPKTCNNINTAIPLINDETSTLLVCGNAINQPVCRSYSKSAGNDSTITEFKLKGKLFLMPHLYQSNFLSPTQNIPPFAYSNSLYFFHSYSQVQDIYKQNYVKPNGEIQLGDLIKTPLGAIKSTRFNLFRFIFNVFIYFSQLSRSEFPFIVWL
jgi:hypothetical protein